MKKIVITGGPCSGKTTAIEALRREFGDQITIVPEAATMLLSSGFPVPGRDCAWTLEWSIAFQRAVVALQRSLEDTYAFVAKSVPLLVCDRGLLDGAGYTQGGVEQFSQMYGVDVPEVIARYEAVVHLESLAVSHPEKYGKTGNDHRFEPLQEAQKVEMAIRLAWSCHPRHVIICGEHTMESKTREVIRLVQCLLSGTT